MGILHKRGGRVSECPLADRHDIIEMLLTLVLHSYNLETLLETHYLVCVLLKTLHM